MAGRADAFNDAMTDIAADPGDYGDRQLPRDQHRTLLDVQLHPRCKALRVDERLSLSDALHVDPDLGHALAQGEVRIGNLELKVGCGEPAEECARSHVGLAEAGAFLPAKSKKLHRPAWPEIVPPETGKDGQACDDAGSAVEVAALRHGIEVRSASQKRQSRLTALKRDDQVGARVALASQAERSRLAVDDVEGCALAVPVALSCHSDAVAGRRGKRPEQLVGELTHLRILLGRCGHAGFQAEVHVGGLSHARSGSSASSITTPPVNSETRAISR